jgi:hypothetical protein
MKGYKRSRKKPVLRLSLSTPPLSFSPPCVCLSLSPSPLPCCLSLSFSFACVVLCKMERGAWQSRARACPARTVNTVTETFKKPRHAQETPSSLDTDSEGPTQLPARSQNEGTPELSLKTTKNTEHVPGQCQRQKTNKTMSPYIPP